LTERRLGFLPRLGQHLGKIRVGSIGMLALECRSPLVRKSEKGGPIGEVNIQDGRRVRLGTALNFSDLFME